MCRKNGFLISIFICVLLLPISLLLAEGTETEGAKEEGTNEGTAEYLPIRPEEKESLAELEHFLDYYSYEKLRIPAEMDGLVKRILVDDDLCLVQVKNKGVVYKDGEQIYAFRLGDYLGEEWDCCWAGDSILAVRYWRADKVLTIDIRDDGMEIYRLENDIYSDISKTRFQQRGIKQIKEGYYGSNKFAESKPFLDRYILQKYDRIIYVKDGVCHILYETDARKGVGIFLLISLAFWTLALGGILAYVIVYHKVIRKKVVIEKFSDIFYYHWKKE